MYKCGDWKIDFNSQEVSWFWGDMCEGDKLYFSIGVTSNQ